MPDSLDIVKKLFPDVERVKNATKSLTIIVTRADATGASKQNHKDCAMARACKRMPGVDNVIVSVGVVYLIKGDTAYRYRTTQGVSREIVAFDRGGGFAAGEYLLGLPERKAPRGSGTRHAGNPRMGNRPPAHVTSGIRTKLQDLP